MSKPNVEIVFLLHHVREDDEDEDIKLIGVFSSEEKAIEVRNSIIDQPGFKDYPDGFSVDRYVLDKVSWAEGFGFEENK